MVIDDKQTEYPFAEKQQTSLFSRMKSTFIRTIIRDVSLVCVSHARQSVR